MRDRARVAAEIAGPPGDWENFYAAAGDPARITLIGFRRDALKSLTGKTLSAVAAARGRDPEDELGRPVPALRQRRGVPEGITGCV